MAPPLTTRPPRHGPQAAHHRVPQVRRRLDHGGRPDSADLGRELFGVVEPDLQRGPPVVLGDHASAAPERQRAARSHPDGGGALR